MLPQEVCYYGPPSAEGVVRIIDTFTFNSTTMIGVTF
ncbi:uncharacterized protein METZ01_LOCUS517609, partial [marine metagenome]